MPAGPPRSAPGGYRPDIDGLRAVAVLAVLAFHARLPFVTGGFIGVDVFFVISGYLISAIIMREIAQDRFSVLAFYERRIRRIFPAMLAMFLVVTLVAAYLLLPFEVVTYAQSLLAALFSGSNFLFWHQVGYFDASSAYKPLLHTWSLAVEEQFYIFFPPFLLLLKKFWPRRTKAAILTVTAFSFAASIVVVAHDTSAGFYFAPLRAWELLFGTILSQHYLPPLRRAFERHLASVAGLAMILLPVYFYQETTPFPGLAALPPCLGAALIIAAGETGPSIVGRVLSWRPVVFVGLISYSLYLWHWPVIVFQTTDYLFVPARYAGKHLVGPAIILVSFALAILSWAFIEKPFRSGRLRSGRTTLFLATGGAVAVLSAMALGLILLHGLPSRYPPDARQVAAYLGTHNPGRNEVCFITPASSFKDYAQDVCLAQHPGRKSILLIGDSYAASLYRAFTVAFPDRDILQANASACRALLHEPEHKSRDCKDMFNFIFGDFLVHHHVDTIVLAGSWRSDDLAPLGETLAWTTQRGLTVVVAGPNAGTDAPLPRILATELREGLPDNAAGHADPSAMAIDSEMAERDREQWHVPYVSFFDAFCKPDCPVYAAPLVPMNLDGGHLTYPASVEYVDVISSRIRALEGTAGVPR
jgi:peptidoglycan/LPS O-acetylase OafA/YrhL